MKTENDKFKLLVDDVFGELKEQIGHIATDSNEITDIVENALKEAGANLENACSVIANRIDDGRTSTSTTHQHQHRRQIPVEARPQTSTSHDGSRDRDGRR